MNDSQKSLKSNYENRENKIIADFFTFLRFKSISSEPEYQKDVRECMNWLREYIEEIGFQTEVWESSGHPILFASFIKSESLPTLLIYNHYDVQPVDPLELWDTPPFEPHIKNGEIYARGAQDNKGQCFSVLQGLKLLLDRDGTLPINIKLCIEGEEETGSEALSSVLETKKDKLQADYLAVVDLGIPSMDSPTLSLGIRGIVTFDLTVKGSNTDLHSGQHGGIVYNPIHGLVEILSQLHNPEGEVTIPGFYDDVEPLSAEDRKRMRLEFDAENYKKTFAAHASGGEKAFSPLERAWVRPTLEINGIFGGYAGAGFKTVIPASAGAKISCRLVPDQDPEMIASLVIRHIQALAPEGLEVNIQKRPGVGRAIRADSNSKPMCAFLRSYEEIFQKNAGFILQGGSIPIVEELVAQTNASPVLLGLGLPDDQIHAPNEHFGVERLKMGSLIMARAIELLAKNPPE